MTSRGLFVGVAIAIVLLLAGCGQRGPLYLPEDAPPRAETGDNGTPSGSAPASGKAKSAGGDVNDDDDEER